MVGSVTSSPSAASVPRRVKILVVEDAPSVRGRLVSLILEVPGLELAGVAGSVGEARELLPTVRPDVALLDLRLPDGSGLDVLREARALDSGIFVAMFTAFDTPRVRSSCLAAGADAFLSKTSEIDELPALLRSIAGKGGRS
jgi:two-component system, NarL family, response regulator DevR